MTTLFNRWCHAALRSRNRRPECLTYWWSDRCWNDGFYLSRIIADHVHRNHILRCDDGDWSLEILP